MTEFAVSLASFSRQFFVCHRLQSVVDAMGNSPQPASAGLSRFDPGERGFRLAPP